MGLDVLDALLGHGPKVNKLLGIFLPRHTSPRPSRGVATMGTTRPSRWAIATPRPETAAARAVASYSPAGLACLAPQANGSAHRVVDPARQTSARLGQALAALKMLRISDSSRVSQERTE
jgi:hypothetical protein